MAAIQTRHARSAWPIVYGHRTTPSRGAGTAVAWALFLGLGLPFALMGVLTVLARAGVYVDLFRPLWLPWPPEVLKPFLGFTVFALTFAYLAYRAGHRRGFTVGVGVGLTAIRESTDALSAGSPPIVPELPPPPPPLPEDEAEPLEQLD